jgi:hypothetical protein
VVFSYAEKGRELLWEITLRFTFFVFVPSKVSEIEGVKKGRRNNSRSTLRSRGE